MSLFQSILDKLGLRKSEPPKAPIASRGGPMSQPKPGTPQAAAPKAAVPMVDVVSKLDSMAVKWHGQLNWKMSIVDLLKLLELDSSGKAIQELATELGCPANQMSDSARRNIWLHKTILQKIAENGGNIPKELLD